MSSLPPPSSMDSPTPSTPPYHRSPDPRLRSRTPSRLAVSFEDDHTESHASPVATPPSRKKPTASLHHHLSVHPCSPISLQELLLLSPSAHRRPRQRLVAEEKLDQAVAHRKKGKSRAAASAASPRNVRRARRRLEKEIVREERELGPPEDDVGRARKRRQSRPKVTQKERLSLVVSIPSPGPLPKAAELENVDGQTRLDSLGERILELIMWKNVAKSTLWFGFGSIFFLSSCFSRDYNFSIISVFCHLGILILGFNFFKNSIPQRQQLKWKGNLQLMEEDILRVTRVVLPIANAALAKTQEIFSGEPSMTLKVAPILLFGAKYGHLITLWRLLATGFFLSFTAPKLYSCYSQPIHRRVENTRNWIQEAWESCPRKRFIAASAATVFWNLFSVRARIFAAFISVVILRYHHQQRMGEEENGEKESREADQQQAIVLAE
ncbi:reticulon-like protein B17 isoform X2 [Elaeis guineensis]|uniref:Reticulon-like protein n=1 Tax=Elaeis guineensis var. tenera TaxID=51953 RepID=A0A6J0PM38_ELAGV|nr:reticulon-like protein B17 isoform X2 [Elaeis guineensis]